MVDDFPKGLFRFYKRVYEVVDDPSLDSIISWSKSNKSFVIWNHQELRRRMIFANFHGPFFSNFFSMLKEFVSFGFARFNYINNHLFLSLSFNISLHMCFCFCCLVGI